MAKTKTVDPTDPHKALPAVRKSPANIITNAKNARRAYDKTWGAAARAPMFCRITKKLDAEGKPRSMYRTTRLIGSHAYNIAASGAALNASRVAEVECARMRLEIAPENKRTPWLPSVSKGARLVLEQFLCALAQEAALKGHAVREGSGNAKRLSKKHIKVGWDVVFNSVFGSAALLPKTVYVLPAPKTATKKSKKAKVQEEDEDYMVPDDEVVGDAADLEPEEE